MERTRQRMTEADRGGIAGDLDRLRSHGNASVAEVREFLAGLRGRSPQEVMGLAAESSLIRSLVVATIGTAALLVVLTVVPYWLWGGEGDEAGSAQAAAKQSEKSEPEPTEQQPETPAGSNGDEKTAGAKAGEPDVEKAVEAMGIGEKKEADPKENPLDSELDKLLEID